LKNCIIPVLLCLILAEAKAQQTQQEFVQKTGYLLYLPDGYGQDSTRVWPLLLFLHGSGESGHDLERVKRNGPPKLLAQGKKFPFIVVSPQADESSGWETEALYHLLKAIEEKYHVDKKRIWLSGLSMGGYGTWSLAIKHPEEFAAIVPISGGGDTAEIWKLRYTPVWCFHGALDNTVPIKEDQNMINGLKKYNPSVRFTIYPDAGHDAWSRTYDNDSLYQWLLAQKKAFFVSVRINPTLLKEYTGHYADQEGDTVRIELDSTDHSVLKVITPDGITMIKPASDNLFFLQDDLPFDIRFLRDKKGRVQELLLTAEKKMTFRKLD
jgi:predicted esterase